MKFYLHSEQAILVLLCNRHDDDFYDNCSDVDYDYDYDFM